MWNEFGTNAVKLTQSVLSLMQHLLLQALGRASGMAHCVAGNISHNCIAGRRSRQSHIDDTISKSPRKHKLALPDKLDGKHGSQNNQRHCQVNHYALKSSVMVTRQEAVHREAASSDSRESIVCRAEHPM